MKDISLYKYYANCPFSKRFGAFLCEFFLILITTLGLFITFDYSISQAEGSIFKELNDKVSTKQQELISLISESKLLTFENNEATTMNEIFDNYIVNLTYTSITYYSYNSIDETYYEKENVHNDLNSNYEHDRLNYYYSVFKVENQEDYLSINLNESGLSYYKELILKSVNNDESKYFDSKLTYPLLTRENAIALDEYFIKGNKSVELDDGKIIDTDTLYLDLFNATSNNFDKASKEYAQNYIPYLNLLTEFNNARDNVVIAKILELVIIYFLISFIYYLLLPILFKNGQTIVNKFMRIGFCSRNGNALKWYQNIPKFINFFIAHFIVTALILVLLYSGNSILFFNYKLFGFLNFYIFYILALVYLVVDALFGVFNKKEHLTISDYASYTLAKYVQD